nr:V4R domain-containing protein [Candidatus Njordarchaeum guaymaensis]
MNDTSASVGAIKTVPAAAAAEYPMKELAQRMRLPNIKASFDLVKALAGMVADGKIVEKMTNLRIILFPSLFVLGIWSTFYEILGKNVAPKVITSFHQDTGRTIVKVGKHAFNLEDKYAFEFYFWLISAIGWGEVKKFEFDAEKMEGIWQLEYKGPLPKNSMNEIPFHNNLKGEIIAAGDEALHVPLEVKETKCMALGDPFCEFTWKKVPAKDKELDSISKNFEEANKPAVATSAQTLTLKNDFKNMINSLAMIQEGKVQQGNLQLAAKDTRSIVGLTYRASDFLGEGAVRAVLVRTGKIFAEDDSKRFNVAGKQLVEDYLKFMSVSGWGKFNVVRMDENGGEVSCEHSAFAEEYPQGEKSVCHIVVGVLSALAERAFNRRYLVKELECIAKGNQKCRFEIKPAPK